MKVRFESALRSDPEQMDGMKVHYGPVRRQAPRLLWYLVILVVASPLIYLLGNFLVSQWIVQAKGQVAAPLFASVCAVDDGVVERLAVRVGDRVQESQPLLSMATGGSKAAPESSAAASSMAAAATSELDRARLRVDLAGERFEQMKALREQGAATAGEVEQARTQWLAALDSQALFRQESPQMIGDGGAPRLSAGARLYDGRNYGAPGAGQVREICVEPGQRVQRGQTLITMDLPHEAQVTAYLEPKYLRSAEAGHRVVVVFPDGTRLRGEVAGAVEFSERPPADVPDPLGLRRRSLVVRVRLTDPIPPSLDIAGLPVNVRF